VLGALCKGPPPSSCRGALLSPLVTGPNQCMAPLLSLTAPLCVCSRTTAVTG
jgi:hypothetical protein